MNFIQFYIWNPEFNIFKSAKMLLETDLKEKQSKR